MDLELTGRRALVTGGSRGIGLAVARALAAEGADVALVARGAEALQRAADSVAAESGRRVIAVPADTGDDASVAAMVERVVADLEAEGVAIEGQGCLRVVVREGARVNGDLHGRHASGGSGAALLDS